MGCTPSTDTGKNQVTPGSEQNAVGKAASHKNSNTEKTVANGHASKSIEQNNNQSNNEGGKSVAFEIGFEKPRTYDSLVSRHPPQKFKKLAPLSDAPQFTAEQLEEKIRLAEENRQRELERKKDMGRRSQRLRAEIQRAREAERATEQHKEIDHKLQAADAARQQKQRELDEKKRMREERAQKAREKAKRMKQDGGEELDYEIEKDDAFNADDDSWLEGDNNKREETSDYHTDNDRFNSGYGDRIYSGRESPAKMNRTTKDKPQRIVSSSTADSFDYAYQRNNKEDNSQTYDRTAQEDDFFDT